MSHERNSLSEQGQADDIEVLFKKLLKESKEELDELRAQVTNGEGIFDPIIQKEKELFVRIKLIRQQLEGQWKFIQEKEKGKAQPEDRKPVIDAKNKLILVMKELKSIILLIKNLAVSKEEDQKITPEKRIETFKENTKNFKKQIKEFNENTEKIMNSLLNDYYSLEKNIQRITTLKYGEDVSDTMNIVTATLKALVTAGLAWFDTLSGAAQAAGSIFYPISATFTSSAKLFSFLGRTAQFFIASNDLSREEIKGLRTLESDDTKALLKKSATFKFLAFSFSALSVLAFAGVLATPVGWAFVAATTLVDWIDDGLGAFQRNNKALEKFKTEHSAALANPGHTDNKKKVDKLQILQEKVDKAKSEAKWGFANTVAMILIACGPIPFAGPFLGLAGLAVFGAVSIRNTYVTAKPYVEKYLAAAARYFSTAEPKQEQEITAAPVPTPAPEKKQEHGEVPVRVATQFGKILNNLIAPPEPEKASLGASTEKPTEKPTSSASKKSPSLFKKAANDKLLSSTETPEINKKIGPSSTTTSHNPSI